MKYAAMILAALLTACGGGCGGGGSSSHVPVAAEVPLHMDADVWEVGPSNYPGGNPSHGATAPVQHAEGWQLTIPQHASVHYVTRVTAPLAGKQRITMRFRVELEKDAEIVPVDAQHLTGMLTLYFEQEFLCWTEQCEAQRWYAPAEGRVRPLDAGEYVLQVPLDAEWTGASTSTRSNNPTAYAESLARTGRIGFVLGGGNGVGHGVTATGPARIVVMQYAVE